MKTPHLTTTLATLALPAILLFALPTHAQAAPASLASIDTLLTLSGTKTNIEAASNSLEGRLNQQMEGALATAAKQNNTTISPAQKAALQKNSPQIAAVLRKELSWSSLSPSIIQSYQNRSEPRRNRQTHSSV